MKRLVAAALLFCAACATKPEPTDSDLLKIVVDDYWQHQVETDVSLQTKLGLPTSHLPDPSYPAAQHESTFGETMLRHLDQINIGHLSEEERLTYSLLRWYSTQPVDALRFFWLRSPITPYAFQFYGVNQVFTMKRLETAERVRLLIEYGHFIDQIKEVVGQQRGRGYLLPKPELPLVRGMLASFMQLPDKSMYRGGDNAEAVRNAITEVVNPALQRLIDTFGPDYEAEAPATVGVSQYPGGADAYQYFIHAQTSLDKTPEEIHKIGLAEVARINRELDEIRQQVGFNGSLADFRKYLKSDPRFFGKTSEEIGQRLTSYIRKIEPQIPKFFAKLPRAQYDTRRLDPNLEGAMTFGYYQVPTATDPVGHYMYNGSKPSERNLLFAPALMLHELIPGHHFQMARQAENDALPAFRREAHDNAYTEGWGEYAATLGKEMGMYDDPYDHAGRLMMDSLLSVRLVVDTGMNALGWSREKAMQYMRENTFQSETEIATESLRYSVDIPAQALAYKLGSMKMLELRANAQKALGPRFDIKQFHEWLIASGSMPLTILERHVNEQMMRRPK
jgi:uncharacterized protein (DUF885 family)